MQSKEATQPPFQLRPPIQAQTLNKSNLSPAGKKALTPSEQKHPLPTPSISGPRGKGTPIRFGKLRKYFSLHSRVIFCAKSLTLTLLPFTLFCSQNRR